EFEARATSELATLPPFAQRQPRQFVICPKEPCAIPSLLPGTRQFGVHDERSADPTEPIKPPVCRGRAVQRRVACGKCARAGAKRRGILSQDPGAAPDRLSGRQRL